ncbi:MAG: GGDEF domain-containing protein [Polyangiaceae bacterium]|nr:GGDEF domain-containing protein [Polyangiaceae bacterium]
MRVIVVAEDRARAEQVIAALPRGEGLEITAVDTRAQVIAEGRPTLVVWCAARGARAGGSSAESGQVSWVVWLADLPSAEERRAWLADSAPDLWCGPLESDQLALALAVALKRARCNAHRDGVNQALRRSRARYRALVRNTLDIIGVVDDRGKVRYVSPAIERVLGLAPHQLRGDTLSALVHPDDLPDASAALAESRTPGVSARAEFRVRHANGEWRRLEVIADNLVGYPAVAGIVVNARDVTDRHELEEMLTRQAFFDALTGLPNRVLLMERLDHAQAQRSRMGGMSAVYFVDLDGFKTINDDWGHDVGDAVLVQVAERLSSLARVGDTAARLGGDEFVLLIDSVESHADVTRVAERVVTALRAPLTVGDLELRVTVSVGVAISKSSERASARELIRRADTAMYLAKQHGKDQFLIWMRRHDTERPVHSTKPPGG